MKTNLNILLELYCYGYHFYLLEFNDDMIQIDVENGTYERIETPYILNHTIDLIIEMDRFECSIEYVSKWFKDTLIKECYEWIKNENDIEQIRLYCFVIEMLESAWDKEE